MEKRKWYKRAKFTPESISAALDRLRSHRPTHALDDEHALRVVTFANEKWRHDSYSEFFEDYRKEDARATLWTTFDSYGLIVEMDDDGTEVAVKSPDRVTIHDVLSVFEEVHGKSMRPPKPKTDPRVFIGHGGNNQWRDLKDHLHEKHGYEVEAYEIGARAGHAIRDILTEMLARSSFAILVMTADDEIASGSFHPRLNVVHEAGLFQGKLGFERAIIVVEDGTAEFSNIAGIQQIRFSQGNIKETFGDVLATLKREFGR